MLISDYRFAIFEGGNERTIMMEKVTAVCLRLCSVSQDDGFCGEDDLFSGEDDGFLAKTKDFFIFLHLRQKSFIFANVYIAY